jgi:hypothetical protein
MNIEEDCQQLELIKKNEITFETKKETANEWSRKYNWMILSYKKCFEAELYKS